MKEDTAMKEDIGIILNRGYDIWRRNLNFCIPFILNFIIILAVLFIIGASVFFKVLMPAMSGHPFTGSPSVLISQIRPFIGTIFASIIIFIISALLINAFFTAGAIGMSRAVAETGYAGLSAMFAYGKRKFISIFLVDIIIGLLNMAGLLFLIPGIIQMIRIIPMMRPDILPAEEISTFFTLFFGGIFLMLIYMGIISIVFSLVRYSIIIEDIGAFAGLKKGIKVFSQNKIDVFIIWLLILFIEFAAVMISAIPYVGWLFYILLSLIVIMPLTFIWWTLFYIDRVKPPEKTEIPSPAGNDQ